MMADRGTPLVAIESGTIGRLNNGGLGGITIWFYGDGGDQYYYAHLDDWAPGLAAGQHVAVGTLVGPTVAGFAFDIAGTYTLPIGAAIVLNLVALGAMAMLEEPESWRGAADGS